MADPQMTEWQRAQQIWSVLVFAAREQKVLSYEMLAQITGMSNMMGDELGYIHNYCKHHRPDMPWLNVLAISKKSGRPSAAFPTDLAAEQARVFVYNWLDHGMPSVDDLQEAD